MLVTGDLKRIFVPKKLKNWDLVGFIRENFCKHKCHSQCMAVGLTVPCVRPHGELVQSCSHSQVHLSNKDVD